MIKYPRDLLGYGPKPPQANWPNKARIAVQFVLNYEEGGENCILHGDPHSEAFLSEIPDATNWHDQRHMNIESFYEYGSRAGFWRLHRFFLARNIPLTIFGVASALARSPAQVAAMIEADWEIASHGLKWIDYRNVSIDDERADMQEAIKLHQLVTGQTPNGWYTGRSSHNTTDLAAQTGLFRYLSDTYNDDLPHWQLFGDRHQLMIPYTLDVNDMRFFSRSGFTNSYDFFAYLKDTFDTLYAEGVARSPKMMTIGMHCRILGRPARLRGLEQFVDYIQGFDDIWIAKRIDIAEHWHKHHPPRTILQPSQSTKHEFVANFGEIYEHSAWIAERAFALEIGPAHDCAEGVHNLLARVFRDAGDDERMKVLLAHPDLAGKLASAKRLSKDSTTEQSKAGLEALSDEDRALFNKYNKAYMDKHHFPFIIAARDHDKESIIKNFECRIKNDSNTEFATACLQVERIAQLRLQSIFSE